MSRLHELFPVLRQTLPWISLGSSPTPVRTIGDSGSERARIWHKDDGYYGDGGWGGNKIRKLEWIIPEAKRRNRDTLLTVGGLGTNWGLACALYGRKYGLRTVLALIDQPLDEHVEGQLRRLGSSGATIYRTRSKKRTIATVPWLFLRYRPYFLPAGGSSAVGTLGAVETALELASQVESGEIPEPSHVVSAVGSGGTAAGLLLGLKLAGLQTKVLAVVVNDTLKLDSGALLRLSGKTAALLRSRGADLASEMPDSSQLIVTATQLGEGYGYATDASRRAAKLASKEWNLKLDPVYTSKAASGLLELNDGRLGTGDVVFLNTDGPR
jgi:D-cysteine desulfhydrase